jgi:hypothetical protein
MEKDCSVNQSVVNPRTTFVRLRRRLPSSLPIVLIPCSSDRLISHVRPTPKGPAAFNAFSSHVEAGWAFVRMLIHSAAPMDTFCTPLSKARLDFHHLFRPDRSSSGTEICKPSLRQRGASTPKSKRRLGIPSARIDVETSKRIR